MTSDQFLAALNRLHWPCDYVATQCGYNRSIGHAWKIGRAKVPEQVADWLTKQSRLNEGNPPPKR